MIQATETAMREKNMEQFMNKRNEKCISIICNTRLKADSCCFSLLVMDMVEQSHTTTTP